MFELNRDSVHAIKKGDRKIILDLYRYTFQVLMGNAVRYSSDQEKQMEMVNNAFMKIIANIDQFQLGTAYFSWAKQIVKREIIDDFRKNKRYKELFSYNDDYKNDSLLSEPEINTTFQAEELQLLLDQLPPATKLVFNLYAIDGFSSKEIMDELQISYETVKWHIKEARKRLKIALSIHQTQEVKS
ncbi:RNA polymerase sigma factor [Fluviicola chungangensis]|uniref:RNA polymerase sigma factor n=1 Tax=Fluviicola chungangensis TaxID=2597671 RepID=A0A556MJV7_9FLAO|nr:RNA polymerase sigma factor [Fluviicola chungangensis]TSJ40166.1 RNA polymerase sigma factor [Fluviicola chungangensis]